MGSQSLPNVLIFGEAGAGKSSIINLIGGQKLAHTSNGAVGATSEHQPYIVACHGVKCCLWDTSGLDEGTEGTVPAATAQRNLKTLMQNLARENGINLLIYCMRTGRATKTLRQNYHIFYSDVCQKKVPVALVVTGCESEQGEMDGWWKREEKNFQKYGMHFDAHACVTTLDLVQDLRRESRRLLHEIIASYSKRPPWRIDEPVVVKSSGSGLTRFFKRIFRRS